jgi:DnaJ-class molecular chaperone
MNRADYYQILGLDRGATPQVIKQAYRRLAFQYHPDRNKGNPAALDKMKEINEAYAVLSDPRKRKEYDALREHYGPSGYDRFRQAYSDQDIFRGSDIHRVFEEMSRAFGFRGFEEVFKESYGPGYQVFEFRQPGVWGKGFIFFGPAFRPGYPPKAGGPSEILPGNLGRLTGYLLRKMGGFEEPTRGKDWYDSITLDRQALETGKIKYFHRRQSKELLVTIPPGIKEGQKIRLKGMGGHGQEGEEPGDLYLKVRIRKPFLQKVRDFLKFNLQE